MSDEEKKAIEIIKGLYIEEYDWYVDSKYCTGHSGKAVAIVENSLKTILNLIENQQKEIEEKSTIIMAGAEKVKQLEKGFIEEKRDKFWTDKIREIRDKAEVMDYYSLNDVIDDLSKLIGDYEEDE